MHDEEGHDDEEIHLWLSHDNLALPFTFLSFTQDIGPPAYLGADLPENFDLTLTEEDAAFFRYRLAARDLFTSPMKTHPIFEGRFSWYQRDFDFCFVLMPFAEPWSNRIWQRHLQPTITRAGFRCARADDFLGPVPIVEDIWEQINTAGVVIADLTGLNPNVFYELGIAHTVGTPAILISQEHEIPAFDTAHIRQLRYADNSEGCEKLERELEGALDYIRKRLRFPRTR